MKTVEKLIIVALLVSPLAIAQEPNPYNGTWHASLVTQKGISREGTVIINDQGGTWKITSQIFKNPCAGLQAPIVIQRTSTDELVFKIFRSKALRGCDDDIATLKRVNETTLQGELNDGRKLEGDGFWLSTGIGHAWKYWLLSGNGDFCCNQERPAVVGCIG
jgi:hypothetical protein